MPRYPALLTAEQRGGAAGRLARTRVRQLLQTRASADACGAWRPLSRWPLALQAFVSQVRAAPDCVCVSRLSAFRFFCISGTLNNFRGSFALPVHVTAFNARCRSKAETGCATVTMSQR